MNHPTTTSSHVAATPRARRLPLRTWLASAVALASAGTLSSPVMAAEGEAPSPTGVAVGRRVLVSGPRAAVPVALAVGTGYGYTEPVLGLDDKHHRLLGAVQAEVAVRSWLGLGLRLDGRYDRHAFGDGRASDDGWVGEPRLYARVDRPLGPATSLGGRISLNFPGADAPSIETSAVSGDVLAMLSHTMSRTTVAFNAGYRLDRSAESAGNPDQLGPGDRLALGVSEFNAALLGAAVHHDLSALSLFAEGSWELLVGSGAPGAGSSPLRLGAGARRRLSDSTHVEVLLEGSPSSRPSLRMGAPLSPIPARVGFMAELIVALGGAPPDKRLPDKDQSPPDPGQMMVPRVEVELSSADELPPDTRLVLKQGDSEWTFARRPDGRFAVGDIPPGDATVTASATGYKPQTRSLRLVGGQPSSLKFQLERDLPSGQIRGTVRSFEGRPLTATIRLAPRPAEGNAAATPATPVAAPEERRSDGGAFQFDVPPGRYRVTISATGHDSQTRMVEVEDNGVTVLNVDLRRAR